MAGALVAALLLLIGGCSSRDKPGPPVPWTPGEGGGLGLDAGFNPGATVDPKTCEQAAEIRSYVGCDFWPTVTANSVWSIFDFAVVVANAGDEAVDVSVSRAGAELATATIEPNALDAIYLPWVAELKGPDADTCGEVSPVSSSARVADGAYHLVASRPVIVYQFNALQYAGQGGPAGKDWSSCPGLDVCPAYGDTIGCFSFSNDASLLLPATALTGNYRVTGVHGWVDADMGSTLTLTGTEDGTTATVYLAADAVLQPGGGLSGAGPGAAVDITLDAGEVVQLVGAPDADFSGSLVMADQPIQAISGIPCLYVPLEQPACDHLEESVFPAETLGERYFVIRPSGPGGAVRDHVVRIYGNVDGTSLSYPGTAPAGAPQSIDAGAVVDLGVVSMDFEIVGDEAFAVASFMLGGSVVGSGTGMGDPSQTLATAVEQYRSKYVFLAPHDYDVSYVEVVQPLSAVLLLDGEQVAGFPREIGSSGYGVMRVPLGPGTAGAHVLESDSSVGAQVLGYGLYTSYHYPGGLDLDVIAPPPPIP